MIQTRLTLLRNKMKENGVAATIVPTSDSHNTEYVCEHFACRKYLSGFTGSAGVLVVLLDKAALWTDGRYFIQAAKELEGSGIELMKMGQPETPSMEEYLCQNLNSGEIVGFDGKVIMYSEYKNLLAALKMKNIELNANFYGVDEIWEDRPSRPSTKTFHYSVNYSGKSVEDKLEEVRVAMKKVNTRSFVITKVDEIAWLFNLRARDIPYFPVALAYAIVELDAVRLYIDQDRLDQESKEIYNQNAIQILDYDAIYRDVKQLKGPVLIDSNFVNCALTLSIEDTIVETNDPIVDLKAVKNEVEIKNTKYAHIKDGVAMTKFMYWLKTSEVEGMTECSAQDYLQSLRKEQENYLEDSFSTICAYQENAAMMHYHATPDNDTPIHAKGLLLVDSGGQYLEGTTDITRTFVMGEITPEQKKWFTLALRGHIRLAKANFLYGCRGLNLDILARGPLWDEDMDYQCGTGHGVGHLSNVHEAPNGFRWRIVPERNDSCVLEAGMIQSDEPGVYQEGKFGIRHENELLVQKKAKNEYGQYMCFETLTFVPFDLDGIDPELMTRDEIEWLNAYHKQVYDKIAPYLEENQKSWLLEACRPL